MKINKRIEIVCSTEIRLSSMSLRSRNAVLATLTRHYTEVVITIVNNHADLKRLALRKPDLVFLGMHFIPREPTPGTQDTSCIWISGFLDTHGIAYTGSPQSARELEVNKPMAKQRLQNAGLQTSPFYVAVQNQPLVSNDISLRYPVFIKPTNRGGGVGIDNDSVAPTFAALQSKVQSITAAYQSDSLIEEFLPGREFSTAILKNSNSDDYHVMPVEVVADENENGDRVLGGDLKELNTEQRLEVTDIALKSQISTLALDAFHAIGARDYGRIDIRLDKNGIPHFLEANLLPSLITDYGSFPISCKLHLGLTYEQMILYIVELALCRSEAIQDIPLQTLTPANTAFSY